MDYDEFRFGTLRAMIEEEAAKGWIRRELDLLERRYCNKHRQDNPGNLVRCRRRKRHSLPCAFDSEELVQYE